ncbi:MAG: hypothetical protein A3G23_08135 [Bacteroidetes bacterium RIFCSPLOWO2_12_FULL_37_12]|nr:MAG: hypothetical protein A3G23_08135 [Bacteroidetes bacterium RIFCSPLOWO2_12_FULL_37_12]
MNQFYRKKIITNLVIIASFVLLLFLFFKPLFIEHKQLIQNDILQSLGMSKEIKDFRVKFGEEPLWTNSMFSGMPAYQISTLYPSNFFLKMLVGVRSIFPEPSGIIFIGLVSFYLMMSVFGCKPIISGLGAFAFAFSTNLLIYLEAGHNSQVLAVALIPLVTGGIHYAFYKNRTRGVCLTACGLALELAVNHLQITYYLLLMVLIQMGIYGFLFIKDKKLKPFITTSLFLLLGAIIASGTSAGNLLTTSSYSKFTIRGKTEINKNLKVESSGLDHDYAFAWSGGISETFSLMIPNFKGGASSRIQEHKSFFKNLKVDYKNIIGQMDSYWGDLPFTSGPVYLGAIVCFLFVLGLFEIKGAIKWFLLIVSIISILLSWGKHFPMLNDFVFQYLPGYNKFRAVVMSLFIAQFTFPFLAFLALQKIFFEDNLASITKKNIFKSFVLTGGLCIIFYLLPSTFNNFFKEGETEELTQLLLSNQFPQNEINGFLTSLEDTRVALFRNDVLRTLFYIVITSLIILAFIYNKLKRNIALNLILLCIIADIWFVNNRFISDDNYQKNLSENYFRPTLADQMILRDTTLSYRVLNLKNPFNDARTSYFHKSIGGYHGAKMRRYQDLIENHISKNNHRVINMLNTRWVITGDENMPVKINPTALGNCWFVQNIKKVSSADMEIDALIDFEPTLTAIVDTSRFRIDFNGTAQNDSSDYIRLTNYKPNHLKYICKTSVESFAVFSEIYYPEGWNVSVDEKPAEHIRVNYILRGMKVPAGEHVIEFKFHPSIYFTGERISLACSLILLVFCGWVGYGAWKGKI